MADDFKQDYKAFRNYVSSLESATAEQPDKKIAREIGATLEGLRKEKGLTRKELAAAAGVPLSTYGGYAQGIREPDIARLLRLAKALDTTINDLIGDDAIFQHHYRRARYLATAACLEIEVNSDGNVIITIPKTLPRYATTSAADGIMKIEYRGHFRLNRDDMTPVEEKTEDEKYVRITAHSARDFVIFFEVVEEIALATNLPFRTALITYLRDSIGITFPDDFDI